MRATGRPMNRRARADEFGASWHLSAAGRWTNGRRSAL